jgi:hypothetical protein
MDRLGVRLDPRKSRFSGLKVFTTNVRPNGPPRLTPLPNQALKERTNSPCVVPSELRSSHMPAPTAAAQAVASASAEWNATSRSTPRFEVVTVWLSNRFIGRIKN